MALREAKLKENLPDGVQESRETVSPAQNDRDKKKGFTRNWGRISDSCEAIAIVAVSLGVNLLTSQLDEMDMAGSFSFRRFRGILGSALITSASVCFMFCRWWITTKFEIYGADRFMAGQDIDNSPPLKKKIYVYFGIGMLAFFAGFVIYLTRGLWE